MNNFWDFSRYFLPYFYIIGAGIIILAWLISLIPQTEKTKSTFEQISIVAHQFSMVFYTLATVCFMSVESGRQLPLDFAAQILIYKMHLASIVVIYITGIFTISPQFSQDKFAKIWPVTIIYLIVFPAIYNLYLYNFFKLTEVALAQ